MAQEQISPVAAERRCPNCGTRVARDAEYCFMCGHDLRIQPRRRQRISWVDALLVLAVLAVLAFWWRIASQSRQEDAGDVGAQVLLPTNIPLITPTAIASPTVEPTATLSPAPATPSNVITHQVRQGETLLGIAGIYGVTVEEIQAANNLTGAFIRAGDELVIPVARAVEQTTPLPVVSRFEYTVQAGDAISSIAARFGSAVEEILDANNLRANSLIRPGDVLVVPVRQVPAEVLQTAQESPTPTTSPGALIAPGIVNTIYIEPRLTGPADGATLPRSEAALLRWISVDVLDPNEWYVLLIYPVSGAVQTIPTIWTKTTSYRLDTTWAPPVGQTATYAWQVSVVRVKSGVSSQFALEAASPPSETRRFTWQ
jgi:LysM repeat protein